MKSISLIIRSTVFCLSTLALVAQDPGALKWSYATGGEIYSSPTIGIDGVLYIGVNDITDDAINQNRVIALNPDGSLKWERMVGDWVDAVPALSADGVLYVGSWDGFLYALDCETGQEIWKFETFGVIESSPAIGPDGTVYFGNGEANFSGGSLFNGALYAVNPDGTAKWKDPVSGEPSPYLFQEWVDGSPAIDGNGNIWVGDLWGYLAQVGPGKTELWKVDLGFAIPSSPAIGKNGWVYFGDDSGFILAMEPGNPTPKWFFNTGLASIESSPVIGMDGTVYIGSGSDSVYAFDGETGAVKQGWPFTEPTDVIYSTPAIAENGTVYFGSGDKKLYAVNSSGIKLWSFQTGGFVDSSPAIGPDGTVYVGSTDGVVYAIHGDSPLALAQWPKFRANHFSSGRVVEHYSYWAAFMGLEDTDSGGDPDLDGRANLLEWAFATDPHLPDNSEDSLEFSTGNDLSLGVSWRPQVQNLGLQFSKDMGQWETIDMSKPGNYPWVTGITREFVGDKFRYEVLLAPDILPAVFFRINEIGD